jgi:putative ABC transport system substrate-binding protein
LQARKPSRSSKAKFTGLGSYGPARRPRHGSRRFSKDYRERGYIVGQNVVIEFRCTDGSRDQISQYAEDLVRSRVDVIVASSSPAAVPAKKARTLVPIVFVNVFDPQRQHHR